MQLIEYRYNLAENFGAEIKSRASIESVQKSLLPYLSPQYKIIINFKNVKFISRAVAHQILKLKNEISQKGAFTTFENINPDINYLLDKVSSTTSKNEDATMVYHLHFESEAELEDYLSKLE